MPPRLVNQRTTSCSGDTPCRDGTIRFGEPQVREFEASGVLGRTPAHRRHDTRAATECRESRRLTDEEEQIFYQCKMSRYLRRKHLNRYWRYDVCSSRRFMYLLRRVMEIDSVFPILEMEDVFVVKEKIEEELAGHEQLTDSEIARRLASPSSPSSSSPSSSIRARPASGIPESSPRGASQRANPQSSVGRTTHSRSEAGDDDDDDDDEEATIPWGLATAVIAHSSIEPAVDSFFAADQKSDKRGSSPRGLRSVLAALVGSKVNSRRLSTSV